MSLPDGTHLWGIECEDEVGNINQSVNRTIIVDTVLPKVNISLPINNSIESLDDGYDAIINFYYNVTDINGIRNCTLYINDAVETSNTSVVKGSNSSFTVRKQTASYNWSVKCWDVANNAKTSETFLFSVPAITSATNIGGGSGGSITSDSTVEYVVNLTNTTISNNTTNFNLSISEVGIIEEDKKDLKQIINDFKDKIKNASKEQVIGSVIILSGLGLMWGKWNI